MDLPGCTLSGILPHPINNVIYSPVPIKSTVLPSNTLFFFLSHSFQTNDYHLIYRNCNHFSNALVWKLCRKQIPNYVNRIAYFSKLCSCLLPKSLIEDSPVGGSKQSESSSFLVPTHASMNRGAKVSNNSNSTQAFTGKGYSLSDNNKSGFSSRFANTDMTDRRERARKAALARLEKNNNKQQED